MVNRHQKEQILKQLEQHYISPLTQFYVEVEVLKRVMLGRPFRMQIGVPDSWRLMKFYQNHLQHLSQEAALARLWLFDRYLTNSQSSVFAYDKTLVLGRAFPYFEYQIEEKTLGLNQLLGAARLFYFYKGNDETLKQLCLFAKEQGISASVVIVGALPATILEQILDQNLLCVSEINRPSLDAFTKARGFTNLFSQSADLLLMDAQGTYVKSFTRSELIRQIDTIKESYFKLS